MNNLEIVKDLYYKKSNLTKGFKPIDTTYLFTTEDIKSYMPNLEGKKVLSVASSGDQYFNALLRGAKKVDLFDINYFTKCIISSKKCGIEHLNYETFCTFFGLYDIYKIFDYSIYQNLRQYLDEESITYWDHIYTLSKNDGYSIYDSELIYPFHNMKKHIFNANSYLCEEDYWKLKKILPTISNITFYHTDIKDLPSILKEKYTAMFFSNINTYQEQISYLKIIKEMMNFLEKDGKMYFAYVYNSHLSGQGNFFDTLLQNAHYSSQLLSFNTKDKVYIYTK